MAHFDLPLRTRKDIARTAQLRNLALSRAPRSMSMSALPVNYNNTFLSSPRRRPERPIIEKGIPYLNYGDPDPEPDIRTCIPQLFTNDAPPTYRPSSYPRREEVPSSSSSPRTSFSKAAYTLYWALNYAIHAADRLERDFAAETQYLSYADERTRSHLWTLKLSYRGWQDGDANVPPPDDKADYFATRAGRLLDAIEDMRDADYPSSRDWADMTQRSSGGGGRYEGGVGMEDVRLAMKKLWVSFGAIKELLEGVRVERGRCAVLVREMRSAWDTLNGIKEVWDRSLRRDGGARGVFERMPAADKRPVVFEEEWPDYRGE